MALMFTGKLLGEMVGGMKPNYCLGPGRKFRPPVWTPWGGISPFGPRVWGTSNWAELFQQGAPFGGLTLNPTTFRIIDGVQHSPKYNGVGVPEHKGFLGLQGAPGGDGTFF